MPGNRISAAQVKVSSQIETNSERTRSERRAQTERVRSELSERIAP